MTSVTKFSFLLLAKGVGRPSPLLALVRSGPSPLTSSNATCACDKVRKHQQMYQENFLG